MSGVQLHEGGPTPERVHEAFLAAAEQQMSRAIVEVEGEVKRFAPFRTGHLRRGITSTVVRRASEIIATVGTTTRYAPFLEFGTGLYGPRRERIRPVRARALVFPAGGRGSALAGGRRLQGSAGPGFALSGRRRRGKAGAQASYVFARSVRGVHPVHFFADGIDASRERVHSLLSAVPAEAQRLLGGRA